MGLLARNGVYGGGIMDRKRSRRGVSGGPQDREKRKMGFRSLCARNIPLERCGR